MFQHMKRKNNETNMGSTIVIDPDSDYYYYQHFWILSLVYNIMPTVFYYTLQEKIK